MKNLRMFFIMMVVFLNDASATDLSMSLHDGHIHYDKDVWDILPPEHALRMLRDENINRAMVSATPTEGAEMLYQANSTMVIPMLRPYRSWRHRYFWFKDPALKAYLLEHMARVPYKGFGEFHVFGKDADSAPMADMIELAHENNMALHAHTDLEGMRIILNKASDVVVIWAHGGFDVPVDILRELLDQFPMFYIELSLRDGMVDDDQRLMPEWKTLLLNYPTRFIIGMDTYKPSRWADLPETAAGTRQWLMQLPRDIAADISRKNIDRLFPLKLN